MSEDTRPIQPDDFDVSEVKRVIRKVDGIRGPGVANHRDSIDIYPPPAQAADPISFPPAPFYACVTGAAYSSGDNTLKYAWTEVIEDTASTTGGFADKPDGRSGTTSVDYLWNTVGIYPIAYNEVVLVKSDGKDGAGNTIYHTKYGAKAALFRVNLAQNGGSSGANPPSAAVAAFTYDVSTLDSVQIGTAVAVERPRFLAVHMNAATKGWAYVANDGTLVLADAYETPDQNSCTM